MLAAAVEDRSLTLLGAAVLIAARNPAGLVVPAVFARRAVAQSLRGLVLGHSCRYFSVDDWREIKSEMHGIRVVHRHPPAQRFIAFMGRRECRGMIFVQVIADLVHVRKQVVAHGHESPIAHSAREGIANAELGDFGGKLLVGPQARFRRPVQPLEMMLIDTVFHSLQEITVDQARGKRTHAVFSHQYVPARQQRRGIRADVGENNSSELLSFVSFLPDAILKCALRWLAGCLENLSINVVEPAVIAAAQAAVFDMAEFERSAAMRATKREQSDSAPIVAKDYQIFAQ